MSQGAYDHEAALRSALRAAAEQIEPSAEGYELIQASLVRPQPGLIASLGALWTRLSLRVPDWVWLALDRVAHEYRLMIDRFKPVPGSHEASRARSRLAGWLRPAAAMCIVVFIVTAVVYMAVEVPQAIAPSSSTTQQHNGPGGTQGKGVGGKTETTPGSGQVTPGSSPSPGASSSCTPKKTPQPVITTPSGTPSPSASVSPSPTSSPSPSASTSPSPNPSSTTSSDDVGTAGVSGQSTEAVLTSTCTSSKKKKPGSTSSGVAAVLQPPALTAADSKAGGSR